ncbi:LysM peptidoglycan-binding domain-containing protein [Trichocoleus sp. FACHB-90]|nr:LysM peptidoglycan-binding domain-containing protein [Trichocoleus sp. FACHB-90]
MTYVIKEGDTLSKIAHM